MYMQNLIGGAMGVRRKVYFVKGWYGKLEGESDMSESVGGGERSRWGCSYMRYTKQKKDDGKCCEWESKCQW